MQRKGAEKRQCERKKLGKKQDRSPTKGPRPHGVLVQRGTPLLGANNKMGARARQLRCEAFKSVLLKSPVNEGVDQASRDAVYRYELTQGIWSPGTEGLPHAQSRACLSGKTGPQPLFLAESKPGGRKQTPLRLALCLPTSVRACASARDSFVRANSARSALPDSVASRAAASAPSARRSSTARPPWSAA